MRLVCVMMVANWCTIRTTVTTARKLVHQKPAVVEVKIVRSEESSALFEHQKVEILINEPNLSLRS